MCIYIFIYVCVCVYIIQEAQAAILAGVQIRPVLLNSRFAVVGYNLSWSYSRKDNGNNITISCATWSLDLLRLR